jgi:hypothetical protein
MLVHPFYTSDTHGIGCYGDEGDAGMLKGSELYRNVSRTVMLPQHGPVFPKW